MIIFVYQKALTLAFCTYKRAFVNSQHTKNPGNYLVVKKQVLNDSFKDFWYTNKNQIPLEIEFNKAIMKLILIFFLIYFE